MYRQEFRMQKAVAGTDTGFESAASRFESFITWRPINHYPETGKPPSYSATPELLQLLTSSLARLFKSYLVHRLLNPLGFVAFKMGQLTYGETQGI
jgi:hypothetical protein